MTRSTRRTRSIDPGVVAWPADVAARYVAAGYWAGRPLGDLLRGAATGTPDALALVDGDVRLTHQELARRVDGAALRLRGLGLRPADRMVVQLPNCWEFVVLTLACFRLGVVPVMALPAHRRHEMTHLVERSDAAAIAVGGTVRGFDHQALAHDLAGAAGIGLVLVSGPEVHPGGVGLRDLCAPAVDPADTADELGSMAPDSCATALFLLSGGTTGLPKLIARTHDDYAYAARCSGEVCGFGPDTVFLAVLPMGHNFTLGGPGVVGTLLVGGRVVIVDSPAPEQVFATIERERVTVTGAVPAVVQRWMEYRGTEQGHDLRSLELVQVGGARLPDHEARRVAPVLGCAVQQGYGMAEGLICFNRPADPLELTCSTQGRPISGADELRVVDENDVPVPPGEPGLLLTRGPYTIRGYYRAPEHNAVAFTSDGWFRTGDIVRMRPDGNLSVEGRAKDMINRGGEKVSAEEIENFALQVDGVGRAAAVSVPDPLLGERVCLVVVVRSGAVVVLRDVVDLMERAGVARFTLPERLVVVDELPVTAVGKVDKSALRVRVAALVTHDSP